MMKEGYIPISRRLFEHPFWCEERIFSRFEAWIDLLQEARFEDTKELINNRLVTVTRGQIPISLRFLGTRWGWSTKKVNSFLDMLLSDKMIAKETPKETGQTVVTICNYDKYNFNSETRKQQKKQTGNTEETPGKQQGNNINKENKYNNIIYGESKDSPHTHSFEEIWKMYECKGNKKTSFLKWNKLSATNKKKVAEYIPAYVAATPEKQFRKNFEVFLNKEAWNDELPGTTLENKKNNTHETEKRYRML